ncbi:MAG TPA: hypothetical protein VIL07_01685 [Symbiobacteriaceae bacterium]
MSQVENNQSISTQGNEASGGRLDIQWTEVQAWLLQIVRRLREVFLLQPVTVALSLPAAVISLVLRALVVALGINWLVNRALRQAASAMLGILAGALGDIKINLFGHLLIWAVLSTAAAAGLLYWSAGRERLHVSLALLSDVQWVPVLGGAVSVVLSVFWWPLALVALLMGIIWGQVLFAQGLDELDLPYRRRVLVQTATAAVTALLFWLMAEKAVMDLMKYNLPW